MCRRSVIAGDSRTIDQTSIQGSMMNNRRQFLTGATAVVALGSAPAALLSATCSEFQDKTQESKEPKAKKQDGNKGDRKQEDNRLDSKMVSRFVGSSHGNMKTVKELLKAEPAIVNAAWDWGNGDWETGLGAASHTGQRDIAEFLLENGARMDAFAAAMLGVKPIVAAMQTASPKLHSVPGPHGICLLTHAIYGGKQADEVFDYLLEAGANVNSTTKQKSTPLMAAAGAGRISIVKSLLKHDADPHMKNAAGKLAIDVATKNKNQDVIDVLKKAMARL
jgi:hypothetical protein